MLTSQPANFPSLKTINAASIHTAGSFTVSFSEIGETQRAIEMCSNMWPNCNIYQIPPKQLPKHQGQKHFVTDYEGQVIINVYYNGNKQAPPVYAAPIIEEIKRLLARCGEVKAFRSLSPPQSHLRQFRAEFFNADAVNVAKDTMTSTVIRVRCEVANSLRSCANVIVYCSSR